MTAMQALSSVALCFCVVTLSQFCLTVSSKPAGFSLKLIARDSPDSPLYPGNLTYLERIERFIRFSEGGEDHYVENLPHLNATIEPTVNLRLPIRRISFYYIVQTRVGAQQRTPVYLFADTGSGLIWTQCQPCINCFAQRGSIYDSRTSASYRKLPCHHPFCSGANSLYRCVNNECIYHSMYADGSSTRGVASWESFFFIGHGADLTLVDSIVFGCSNDNRNFRFASTEVVSGVLGLGKSPDSLISQLSYHVNHRFSHCFAPFAQLLERPNILRFGDEIPPPPVDIQTTRFLNVHAVEHLYYLKLLDISVGGVRLGFPPGQFDVRQDGSGGFLIDSGTIVPRIDTKIFGNRNAYASVISMFQDYYANQNLQRLANGPSGFDLCYNYPPGFTDFASMTYHFEGADYLVEGQYNHFPAYQNLGIFCVAIMPFDGYSILGAWHQQNMRITYDLNLDGLQFSPENCLNDIL